MRPKSFAFYLPLMIASALASLLVWIADMLNYGITNVHAAIWTWMIASVLGVFALVAVYIR